MKRNICMIIVCFLLFFTTVAACQEQTNDVDDAGFFFRRYIAITGNGIGPSPKEGFAAYDGVKFPLYCGYVTFYPGGKVVFTKKTDLPITEIVNFFRPIEEDGKIKMDVYSPFQQAINNAHGEYYAKEATIKDDLFQDIVKFDMSHRYSMETIETEWYTETPNENFSPQFTQTCIFNSKANLKGQCMLMGIISKIYIPESFQATKPQSR